VLGDLRDCLREKERPEIGQGGSGGSDPRGARQRVSADYARRRALGRVLQDGPAESDQDFLPAGLEGHAL
jgi:hypothetical protein